MNYLVDTATFMHMIASPKRLSRRAFDLLEDPDNALFLSAVSVWEICVKHAAGKLPLPTSGPPSTFIREQRRLRTIQSLSVTEAAALRVSSLPKIHGDPFDRLLICQAIEHALTIVTPDRGIARYPVEVIW
jgi:PIN domain nuclease of toxin-antitoxin system